MVGIGRTDQYSAEKGSPGRAREENMSCGDISSDDENVTNLKENKNVPQDSKKK